MGLERAQRYADDLARQALEALADIALPQHNLQALRGLTEMVVRRQH